MKELDIGLCGTQHPQISSEFKKLYSELFTAVKSSFPDIELSKFFPIQGITYDETLQLSKTTPFDSTVLEDPKEKEKYLEPAVRLMVFGRSPNGWTELSEKDAKSFSRAASSALTSYDGFSWLTNEGRGVDTYIDKNKKECRYNINKSAFFRTIRRITNELKPISNYQPRWFENIVWSNLYTVSPKDSGNAEGKLQDIQLEISKKIIVEQIKFYKPTHILFITDWDYWFERFSDIFPEVEKTGDSQIDNVVGHGKYNNTKIVVTIRPDRTKPNKPNEEKFALDVVNCFKS